MQPDERIVGTIVACMLQRVADLRRIKSDTGPAWLEAKTADKTGVVGLETDRGRCRSHTRGWKTVWLETLMRVLDTGMTSTCHAHDCGVWGGRHALAWRARFVQPR
ncbi:hypothetical protein [Ralstonia flaminis]|uniref:hypothetical protein n=1 Tax=Ralstonia flaminis TaxID=3058597 RepID=UPI00292F45F4|nr:hypothetical protein [Ralstonia sp. LMG 18101]